MLAQIEQIKSGLHKVKAVNIKAKQIYDKESLQARENDLAKLLPTEWKRAELLRWLTNAIQKNGLIFEEQTLQEQAPQAFLESLNIHLKMNGQYEQLQQFMQLLTKAPRLMELEGLHVENQAPASSNPDLKIDMILSAHKRVGLLDTEN